VNVQASPARIRAILVAIALSGAAIAMLTPEELPARRTVGHQGRALRLRRIVPELPSAGPRVCKEGEITTDRDPCILPSSKAAFDR
jgi:hypothetical protein